MPEVMLRFFDYIVTSKGRLRTPTMVLVEKKLFGRSTGPLAQCKSPQFNLKRPWNIKVMLGSSDAELVYEPATQYFAAGVLPH
jgi:hypothetical protein